MGFDLGSIHAAHPTIEKKIEGDLKRRPATWLAEATEKAAVAVREDYDDWVTKSKHALIIQEICERVELSDERRGKVGGPGQGAMIDHLHPCAHARAHGSEPCRHNSCSGLRHASG
jgi:hypothetical protein